MKGNEIYLIHYVEGVVDDYATEADPGETRWPTPASLDPLCKELRLVIEGAVADWLTEKRVKK